MNVVGWKGDMFPFKLNVRDIRPMMSDRIHLAPSAWVTFEAVLRARQETNAAFGG